MLYEAHSVKNYNIFALYVTITKYSLIFKRQRVNYTNKTTTAATATATATI